MSYFAKPNFIIYDEWFDDDLENFKIDVRNTKIKPISYLHDFFYEQSNYKVGGSENNFEFKIKVNDKKLLNNFYYGNSSEKLNSISNNNFRLFKKIPKRRIKFNIPIKLIYSLSIVSFIFIFGSLIFFWGYEKNDSEISNRFSTLARKF